jgi:hypothetical protein
MWGTSWLTNALLSSQDGLHSKELKPAGTVFGVSQVFCCLRSMFEVLLWCPPFSIYPVFCSSSVNIRGKFISADGIFLSFLCFVTKLTHPLRSSRNFMKLSLRTLSRLVSECRINCVTVSVFLTNTVNNVYNNIAFYPLAGRHKFTESEKKTLSYCSH